MIICAETEEINERGINELAIMDDATDSDLHSQDLVEHPPEDAPNTKIDHSIYKKIKHLIFVLYFTFSFCGIMMLMIWCNGKSSENTGVEPKGPGKNIELDDPQTFPNITMPEDPQLLQKEIEAFTQDFYKTVFDIELSPEVTTESSEVKQKVKDKLSTLILRSDEVSKYEHYSNNFGMLEHILDHVMKSESPVLRIPHLGYSYGCDGAPVRSAAAMEIGEKAIEVLNRHKVAFNAKLNTPLVNPPIISLLTNPDPKSSSGQRIIYGIILPTLCVVTPITGILSVLIMISPKNLLKFLNNENKTTKENIITILFIIATTINMIILIPIFTIMIHHITTNNTDNTDDDTYKSLKLYSVEKPRTPSIPFFKDFYRKITAGIDTSNPINTESSMGK